jgi:hypothetical protein
MRNKICRREGGQGTLVLAYGWGKMAVSGSRITKKPNIQEDLIMKRTMTLTVVAVMMVFALGIAASALAADQIRGEYYDWELMVKSGGRMQDEGQKMMSQGDMLIKRGDALKAKGQKLHEQAEMMMKEVDKPMAVEEPRVTGEFYDYNLMVKSIGSTHDEAQRMMDEGDKMMKQGQALKERGMKLNEQGEMTKKAGEKGMK